MTYTAGAIPVWFNRHRELDAECLQAWRESPLTFAPDQVIDDQFNADHYEIVLGRDTTGNLFTRAAMITLMNQFYPPDVMANASDFGLENRSVQVGDRVLQRIHIFRVAGRPVFELLTMNEITRVIQEPRRAGFTYTTTAVHNEIGEFSPAVEWHENGEVVLRIDVLSRTLPGASALSRWLNRRMQLKAHRLSIQNFLTLLRLRPISVKRDAFPVELLPVGMLLAAFLLLVSATINLVRGQDHPG